MPRMQLEYEVVVHDRGGRVIWEGHEPIFVDPSSDMEDQVITHLRSTFGSMPRAVGVTIRPRGEPPEQATCYPRLFEDWDGGFDWKTAEEQMAEHFTPRRVVGQGWRLDSISVFIGIVIMWVINIIYIFATEALK